MDPLGVWTVGVSTPSSWGVVENKPKYEVKIQKIPPQNEYKTQHFAPASNLLKQDQLINAFIL